MNKFNFTLSNELIKREVDSKLEKIKSSLTSEMQENLCMLKEDMVKEITEKVIEKVMENVIVYINETIKEFMKNEWVNI